MLEGDSRVFNELSRTLRDWFPILTLLISGLVWGMKLEARYDVLEERLALIQAGVSQMNAQTSSGVLPLTQERLTTLRERVLTLESRIVNLESNGHALNR